jgi:hypothetical protein
MREEYKLAVDERNKNFNDGVLVFDFPQII